MMLHQIRLVLAVTALCFVFQNTRAQQPIALLDDVPLNVRLDAQLLRLEIGVRLCREPHRAREIISNRSARARIRL